MDAVAVSVWDKGLAVCKATKLADGRYNVDFEYVQTFNAAVAGDVAAALRGSRLPSGVNSLVRARASCKYSTCCLHYEEKFKADTSTDNAPWRHGAGLTASRAQQQACLLAHRTTAT
jgi:hypothetical protein